jgi:lycopene cyclase domain-containing protein
MFSYLLINILTIGSSLLFSFEKRIRYIQYGPKVILSTLIVGIPFLIWDYVFTKNGVWGFTSDYLLGFYIFGLPLEEIMFFFCIPFASIHIYFVYNYFSRFRFSQEAQKIIAFIIASITFTIGILNFDKNYTSINFLIFAMTLYSISFYKRTNFLHILLSYMIILIPFFIVNGALTSGFSFISESPIVWYDDTENLSFRLGSIPIEDVFYGFTLIFMNIKVLELLGVKPKSID